VNAAIDKMEALLAKAAPKTRSGDEAVAEAESLSPVPKRGKYARLTDEARQRFNQIATSLRPAPAAPPEWRESALSAKAMPERPNDGALRESVWSQLEGPRSSRSREALTLLEEIEGMGPGEYGPPILSRSALVRFNDEVGDGLDEARVELLATSKLKVLHEIEVRGHALDDLDADGRLLHDQRPLRIDEEVTRHRLPLEGDLYRKYGWADPDHPDGCALLLHPPHAALLVSQQRPSAAEGSGEPGEAEGSSKGEETPPPVTVPVLMYSPALPELLPPGHPGRVALEALQPAEGESWLDCVLPLPPDHTMHGWTLRRVLAKLPPGCKPYGHGHGFEFLTCTGTQGDAASCTWVPRNKRGSSEKRVQRPLIAAQSILAWDDASSALHYGIVNACIPAAEAAMELLLPPDHPSRKARTRLAPYGRVFTYQAGKWYVSKVAAKQFPGLVRYGGGADGKARVDSYDEATSKARTIEPHFDTGNATLWGFCVILGRFEGFEQTYPTCRLLLSCGHLSFAFGPYGQLCHAVAQGTGDEPRCCVLLHIHQEMTAASSKPLRFDLAGVDGCLGRQEFEFDGRTCNAGMGFEQSKSRKSVARNDMEMALRQLPRLAPDPPPPTPADLRSCFINLCLCGQWREAAPLLGDVVLLTFMSADFRAELRNDEAAVRKALRGALEAGLQAPHPPKLPASPEAVRGALEYIEYLPVRVV